MPDDLPRIPKKRRPRNKPREDAWLQQQLSAYRPVYTFRCALPGVLIYSFLCAGISFALYKNSLQAFEYSVDYTDCRETHDDPHVEHYQANEHDYCTYRLRLPEVKGQIFFYYGLHGFYQNIRKYEQSRNDRQLRGKLKETEDCYPYENVRQNGVDTPIVPCGAVANSMFNDTFRLTYRLPDKVKDVELALTTTGLLHPNFRTEKYRNPKQCTSEDDICPGFEGYAKPPAWNRSIAELGDEDTGRALENFDFIQWMETSALPNFRKLYRKLSQPAGSIFVDGLPKGEYTLHIEYNYNVSEWAGRKLFIVASNGPLGPRATFQMLAFFVLGAFLFVFGVFMALVEFSPACMDRLRDLADRISPPEINGM